jgi:hypothetical protein
VRRFDRGAVTKEDRRGRREAGIVARRLDAREEGGASQLFAARWARAEEDAGAIEAIGGALVDFALRVRPLDECGPAGRDGGNVEPLGRIARDFVAAEARYVLIALRIGLPRGSRNDDLLSARTLAPSGSLATESTCEAFASITRGSLPKSGSIRVTLTRTVPISRPFGFPRSEPTLKDSARHPREKVTEAREQTRDARELRPEPPDARGRARGKISRAPRLVGARPPTKSRSAKTPSSRSSLSK